MKTEVLKPNIIRIAYKQEPGDTGYGSCLWAYFDFDLDRYMLNIQSDCGNAACKWFETKEPFLHLMARCDEGYLLTKFFGNPEMICPELTISEIEKDFNEVDFEDELDELRKILSDYDGAPIEYTARLMEEWNEKCCMDIDNVWDYIVTDYTGNQKKIVEVFEIFVKPKIKEMLKEQDGE